MSDNSSSENKAPSRVWAWSFNDWEKWGGHARADNLYALDEMERRSGAEYIRSDLAAGRKQAEAFISAIDAEIEVARSVGMIGAAAVLALGSVKKKALEAMASLGQE